MSEKREGTFLLDGMLEGQVPSLPGAAERIRAWADKGLGDKPAAHFNLEIDGGRFNLLADNHPRVVADLDERPEDAIAFALEDLLKAFPPAERTALFSTLRSIEYRKNQEVQTVYSIGAQGRVRVQQQIVAAETTTPPAPLTPKEKRRQIQFGVLITVGVIALSAFFIDYRRLFAMLRHPPEPRLALENAAFAPYFTVQVGGLTRDGEHLILHLTRTDAYPLTDDQLAAAATQPAPEIDPPAATQSATQSSTQRATQPDTQSNTQPATPLAPSAFHRQLVLQSLARGYIRIELFNEKNAFIGTTLERIADLRLLRSLDLAVPLPHDGNTPLVPKRLRITYE